MVKIRKYANVVERFLRGDKGQRFFNFAYSIGAAIVIWGALFKILHLPGGNTLLCIGMGTEVMMFILTAFDRPPKEYAWEEVFPELEGGEPGKHNEHKIGTSAAVVQEEAPVVRTMATPAPLPDLGAPVEGFGKVVEKQCADYTRSMDALNRNIVALNQLYELQLKTMSAQVEAAERAGCGMKDIRDMYEKSASQSALFCEETEKMARNMRRLNDVYERMLTAMTVNMGLAPAPVEMPRNPFDTAEGERKD